MLHAYKNIFRMLQFTLRLTITEHVLGNSAADRSKKQYPMKRDLKAKPVVSFLHHPLLCRPVTTTAVRYCEEKKDDDAESKKKEKFKNRLEGQRGYTVQKVDWQTSMAYMESDAYKEVYGDEPVWVPYRRNYKGHFKPDTRRKCIRSGTIHTGSACPICRDDFLVIDYRNEKLLKQLIIEETAQPFPTKRTGICQDQQRKLQIELAKAIDCGYIEAPLPFRGYDYDDFHKMVAEKEEKERTSS